MIDAATFRVPQLHVRGNPRESADLQPSLPRGFVLHALNLFEVVAVIIDSLFA